MNLYLELIAKFIKKEKSNKTTTLLTASTYLFILLLYFYLVEAALAPQSAFLYIAATQAIVSCFSSLAFEINNDLNSNRFDILATLPTNYSINQMIRSTCTSLFKYIPILIILAFISKKNLVNFSILHFLACLLYNSMSNFIGLMSYFIRDIKQIFYLNLTLTFALGGLFTPTDSYLSFLKKISAWTPYPYILSVPAKVFAFNENLSVTLILKYIIWIGFFGILTNFTYNFIAKEK